MKNNYNKEPILKNIILSGFIVAKFLIQYSVVNPVYELHRDEFLHLDQARHLAWGYTSVPPVTSWISSIILFLGNLGFLGSIEFWVRFFPALFGAITIFIIWKAIEALEGNLFALVLGATSVLCSVLLRLNILYHPNSFDVLAWTIFYFMLIKYVKTEKPKFLYLTALVFSIGFLNKYNIVFLLLGLFPALIFSLHSSIFKLKEFYFSVFLVFILILPNLIWQYQNHFPVVHHLKELSETQLINVNRFDFLKDQILFFINSIWIIIASFYAFVWYEPFKKYRFFLPSLVFTLAVFIYFRAKSYYAIGIYPIYISFGATFLGHQLKEGWVKYLQPMAFFIPILGFIPFSKIIFPDKSPEYIVKNFKPYKDLGLLRWEDGKDHPLPQDFADMLGWKELAFKVDAVYDKLSSQNQTLILCDNYGQAGAINFYSKNKEIHAVSFNADYIHWFDLKNKTVNLIRIKNFEKNSKELKQTSPYFKVSYVSDSITNSFARELGTKIFVFENATTDVNKRIIGEMHRIESEL